MPCARSIPSLREVGLCDGPPPSGARSPLLPGGALMPAREVLSAAQQVACGDVFARLPSGPRELRGIMGEPSHGHVTVVWEGIPGWPRAWSSRCCVLSGSRGREYVDCGSDLCGLTLCFGPYSSWSRMGAMGTLCRAGGPLLPGAPLVAATVEVSPYHSSCAV